MRSTIRIATNEQRHTLNITDPVARAVPGGADGVATVFIPHTTAVLLVLDIAPGMGDDILAAIAEPLPHEQGRYLHNDSYEHVSAHILAGLIGPSVSVLYGGSKLLLGTW